MKKIENIFSILQTMIKFVMVVAFTIFTTNSLAQELLTAQQAFKFSAKNSDKNTAELSWQIAPNYYLYQQKIAVMQNQQTMAIKLPEGEPIVDENFGKSKVYWQQLNFSIPVEPNQQYQVMWQGCAKDQLCYAPQKIQFSTDENAQIVHGLASKKQNNEQAKSVFLAQHKPAEKENQTQEKSTIQANAQQEQLKTAEVANIKTDTVLPKTAQQNVAVQEQKAERIVENPTVEQKQSEDTTITALSKTAETLPEDKVQTEQVSEPVASATEEPATTVEPVSIVVEQPVATETAQDQKWLNQLQQSSFFYAVLIFLGLGFLLAFTPCSLPMIPILSSLIVRKNTGLKAWVIALCFVLSMASVYAVMGVIASSIGLGLQRWLQQPMVLIAFALLFVVFALNLLGLFELTLPNKITQKLNALHSQQQGGTLLGAVAMGALSALLVGPCMTAPLAGVLLFIAQTEAMWQGGVLLFALGFGMGIPLLLVSVLGAKVLPQSGEWLERVKGIFAFIMLALSLYFIRSLLPDVVLLALQCLLGLSLALYLIYYFVFKQKRMLAILLASMAVCATGVIFYQLNAHTLEQRAHQNWLQVKNKTELMQVLAQHPQQKVVIDVYADWCVSCKPIEKFLATEQVATALQPYVLVKLDLSQYDATHQPLLDELEVLGPPTMMFLNEDHQEQRALRLTGSFKQDELMQVLKSGKF